MRKHRLIAVLFLILYFLAVQCTKDTLPAPEDSRSIVLRWVPAYGGERWEQVETGLKWSFSFLGAKLPAGSLQEAITPIDDKRFKLNLEQLGFSEKALHALQVIASRLKTTEEYQTHGAVGLGRFLVLTLHSSWHYYEITSAPRTLEDFMERRALESQWGRT